MNEQYNEKHRAERKLLKLSSNVNEILQMHTISLTQKAHDT